MHGAGCRERCLGFWLRIASIMIVMSVIRIARLRTIRGAISLKCSILELWSGMCTDLTVALDQNIFGLDITVHQVEGVNVRDGLEQLLHDQFEPELRSGLA